MLLVSNLLDLCLFGAMFLNSRLKTVVSPSSDECADSSALESSKSGGGSLPEDILVFRVSGRRSSNCLFLALFAIALQSLIEEDISIQQLPTAFIFSSACSAFEHKKEFTQLQITSKMCLKC